MQMSQTIITMWRVEIKTKFAAVAVLTFTDSKGITHDVDVALNNGDIARLSRIARECNAGNVILNTKRY